MCSVVREVGVRVFADWNVLAGRVLRRQPPFRTFLSVTVRHQQAPLFLQTADFQERGRRDVEQLTAWIETLELNDMLGMIQLDRRVFGAKPRLDILHRIVLWQRAKRRSGTAKTKTRGEVSGGGRKPWRQKVSGRARQGSIRAPHWRGGGVVHGPVPKSYYYSLPKQVRRLGLKVALSVKYAQGDLHVVDKLHVNSHKTRDMVSLLEAKKWKSVLFIDSGYFQKNFRLAVCNIQKVHILPSRGINVYSILLSEKTVLSVNAVKTITRRLTDNPSLYTYQSSAEDRSQSLSEQELS